MRRYSAIFLLKQQQRFLFRLLFSVTLSVLFLLQMLSLSTRGVSAFTRSRATRTRIRCTVGRGTSASISRYYSPSFSLEQQDEPNFSGYSRPVVQWYPGHIAKAERQLQETIKAVDVVVEVRDARIPRATSHPLVAQWCAGRPRLVVLTHSDTVPEKSMTFWRSAYRRFGRRTPRPGLRHRQAHSQPGGAGGGGAGQVLASLEQQQQKLQETHKPATSPAVLLSKWKVLAKQRQQFHRGTHSRRHLCQCQRRTGDPFTHARNSQGGRTRAGAKGETRLAGTSSPRGYLG